ncbi:DUF6928 family protein [Actinoplanes sp. NPDC049668]|uniref:DUF6928 family protein n=1 Tax=unclassified Actinoplanes TaxID=2626549 RepID=UPI0033A9A6A3
MGAKTALLAFTDGDLRPALLGATRSTPAEAEALVRTIHPGHEVTPAEDGFLAELSYPPDNLTYATVLAGAEILSDNRLVLDRPSQLPEHLVKLGTGRRIVMHGMHSTVDWLCFAMWENGNLIRSLSLSPDGGIAENIGEPFAFERPFWAGEHSVEPNPDWEDEEPYPLPFHPLELGEEALRALFGFVLEDYPHPDDINADAVHLHGFLVREQFGRD